MEETASAKQTRPDDTLAIGEVTPELSLHSVTGHASPGTLRFRAQLEGLFAIILVDNEASLKFVSERFAKTLPHKAKSIAPVLVKVANNAPMQCQTIYSGITLVIQGLEMTTNLCVLPLTEFDVILAFLGFTVWDWNLLTMRLKWRDKEWTLQGMTTARGIISMKECVLGGDVELAIFFWPIDLAESREVDVELQAVLERF
ncbi:unnamed protein product [Linum trigynum]|uniref:Uncharacterized protein n=1 Tax=Linum trigynum TaxID=586398 RepID=A0AAV2FQ54_9ROSI